ncbi:Lipase, GDSL [Artemisia annua]|uniref:Lipase, GDSL n=1 Tax=Artemisia annua TaxID=35608 RepID=A0A2U1K8W6_ARTAN|nr:Lipase, GDSL [Artemisia annua]
MASHFFFLLILCLLTLSRASESPRKHALFVFGDSFFDPGNNNYINTSTLDQANFPPYGETHFHFPTGRFSDGRIIPDFILEYAKLPLIPPYMSPRSQMYYRIGANFASAGAGALAETFQGAVISLKTQLSNHKTVEERLRKIYGNTEAKNTLSKAVYLFSIGTNDYISPYLITNSTRFNSTYSNSQLVQIVIGNLTTAIKELHKRGGRKFGFLNLGPLGCLPGIRIILNPSSDSGGCIEAASLLAKLHNQALAKSLKRLAKQLHGFKYSLYDFNTNLNQRLKHPSKYGYNQGKTACCGTGRFRGTFSCGGKRPGIYKMGGRKFGILNVPPLACLPSIRAGRSDNTCNKELDIISSLHNQKLSKKLQELEKHLEGFKYAKFDFSTAVSNRMNNPSKYGFKVGNSACCGSGPYRGIYSCGGKRGLQEYELCDNINDYLFFDSYHPNEVANRQYSELFWKADSNVTTPYNLKTLFQGEL